MLLNFSPVEQSVNVKGPPILGFPTDFAVSFSCASPTKTIIVNTCSLAATGYPSDGTIITKLRYSFLFMSKV